MKQKLAQLQPHIDWVMKTHSQYARKPREAVRFWDGKTPYFIHPLWAGLTILTETKLPERVRWEGALTLLYHDILEETTRQLPRSLPAQVKRNVQAMTFANIDEEMKLVWGKNREIILFKLYDKVSNLLDATPWMKPKALKEYRAYTRKLLRRVRVDFGTLNITAIAQNLLN